MWHDFPEVMQTANMEVIMTKAQLLKKIALLESINDQLATEVCYVDQLMRMVGFSGGLQTIKATAEEIIQKGLVEPNTK
jgi:hypothetical protein